jgi:transposase
MADADPRDARIAELEREVATLRATNEAQAARIAELEEQVRELMARLDGNSRNSHRPPSSDPPGTPPPERRRKKSKRKRGGQPGHDGAQRQLLPPDQVDDVVELIPCRCDHCGRRLRGRDPEPLRTQTTELPRPKPKVTEYQQHTLGCDGCGALTQAPLPPEVVGAFGPQLVALVVYMTAGLRLSKRVVARYLADVLGVSMASGTVCKLEQRALEALEPAVVEAREAVRSADTVHADETGWREDKKRAWMWVFATSVVTWFVIARSRGRKVLEKALEGFKGKLVSDRWSPYLWVDVARRQLCWAHLARDFQWMLERASEANLMHVQVLVDGVDTMFRWWHKLREDKMTRRGFRRCMTPLRERMEEALAALAEDGSVAGKAEEIWKLRQGLWTFVDNEGIEPTNNLAERQLRHAVVWRKCSYGTDSPAGSRFVEAVLTVVLTARQQGRNALELLNDYIYAHFHKLAPPRLVPDSCNQA